jgi:hypothetical protein
MSFGGVSLPLRHIKNEICKYLYVLTLSKKAKRTYKNFESWYLICFMGGGYKIL